MDLRTGKPVWLERPTKLKPFGKLHGSTSCDVCVIGCGITGALVTHRLLERGFKVVVLDRREVARGSTAASTGLLLYQTDTGLEDLAKIHGLASAERVYALGRRAVRELQRIAEEIGSDCGFETRRTLYVASTSRDVPALERECRLNQRIHFSTTLLKRAELKKKFSLNLPAGLTSPHAAEVDPFRFTQDLVRFHRDNPGLRVFEHTNVTHIEEAKMGVTVHLSRGDTVQAQFAIVAAGYEAKKFFDDPLIQFHSTYVIASAPFPPERLAPLRCLTWETARPYFYLRTTPDYRIVFGGRDEPFLDENKRDRLLARKSRELEKQFEALYPALAFKAAFRWTGTFAETSDGLPCIGPAKPGSRVLYALGYGGNGITFSQLAARVLVDHCEGKHSRDEALFSLHRRVNRRQLASRH